MKNEIPGLNRGRPRGFDRTAALDRAMEAFWRNGYEATSLADLTAAMGISPPSLYSAFGSKKRLFLEAVDRYNEIHGAYSERALAQEPTARAAIGRLLFDTAAAFASPATPAGCLVVTAATNCSPASADVEEALRRQRIANEGTLRERIARGIAAGELPSDTDAAKLAKFYSAVFQGMSAQARDGASRDELEEIASGAMNAWPA